MLTTLYTCLYCWFLQFHEILVKEHFLLVKRTSKQYPFFLFSLIQFSFPFFPNSIFFFFFSIFNFPFFHYFLLTLTEYILVWLMQVFEPTVLLEFPLGTLDSTAVLSSLHDALKLCKCKEITWIVSNLCNFNCTTQK